METTNKQRAMQLIMDIYRLGVELWPEDGKLKYKAPEGVFNDSLKKQVSEHKSEIIKLLVEENDSVYLLSIMPTENDGVFPLTDVQSSYLIGKTDAVYWGGIDCNGYVEVNYNSTKPEAIITAWEALVKRHDMLRASVTASGVKIISELNQNITPDIIDLRGCNELEKSEKLKKIRSEYCGVEFNVEIPPLFHTCITLREEGVFFHLSINLIIADFSSVQILLGEMGSLLNDQTLSPIKISFWQYAHVVQNIKGSLRWQKDREYWMKRISALPSAPSLPCDGRAAPTKIAVTDGSSKFYRLQNRLKQQPWENIKNFASEFGLTISAVVLTAYAETINKWSENSHFTLNLPLQNRLPVHEDICDVVGDFTTINLLEVNFSTQQSFVERARKISAQLIDDIDHRYFTGVEVLRELGKQRGPELSLMPIVFTGVLKAENKSGLIEFGLSQTPQVWLDCQAIDESDIAGSEQGLFICWDVRAEAIKNELALEAFNYFVNHLNGLAATKEIWDSVNHMPELTASFYPQTRYQERRINKLLQTDFIRYAKNNPEKVAILESDAQMSFGELFDEACLIAGYLTDVISESEPQIVAIKMPKSARQICAVMGVLIAGYTYLPIDLKQPLIRQNKIIHNANANVVLTDQLLDEALNHQKPIDPSEISIHPSMPAYVIYTSGSTGEPKGVVMSHQAALSTIDIVTQTFNVNQNDRIMCIAELSFDLSVYDIFGGLGAGATIVLPDSTRGPDPSHWAELMSRDEVTVWNSVPAQAEMLDSYANNRTCFPTVRTVWLSGDLISTRLPEKLRTIMPKAELISMGGATEAGIWSIYHRIGAYEDEQPTILYGRALQNQWVSVYDNNMKQCPAYVPGEIVIGGTSLADGYLHDNQLTEFKFKTLDGIGRVYKTGDRGRVLRTGEIEFLGRLDNQVKINGHRIELAEIESVLSSAPSVSSCCVVYQKDSGPGKLIAYVVKLQNSEVALDNEINIDNIKKISESLEKSISSSLVEQFNSTLEQAVASSVFNAFHSAGIFTDSIRKFNIEDIENILKCTKPEFQQILRQLLDALENHGYIRCEDGFYQSQNSCISGNDYWAILRQEPLSAIAPPAVSKYIENHAGEIAYLLSGETNPIVFLFPDGSENVAEDLYGSTLIADYMNTLLAETVKLYADTKQRSIDILEVGGGIGATTEKVIQLIDNLDYTYLFTDLSDYFLNKAKQQYPQINTAIVDLDNIELAGSYDLIIAAGVLNNVENIPATINKLALLLKLGGMLLITDPVKEHIEILVSQAFMMKGHSDSRQTTGNCFLQSDEWVEVISLSGLQLIGVFPEVTSNYIGFGQQLFIAQKLRKSNNCEDYHNYLSALLPSAMIPETFIMLDELPLTANGKVDRLKLLESTVSQKDSNTVDIEKRNDNNNLPVTELEKRLQKVFETISQKSGFSTKDNLMHMGFDSLLLAQVAGEITKTIPEAFEMRFDELLREMLKHPSIYDLSLYITNLSEKTENKSESNLSSESVSHETNTTVNKDSSSLFIIDSTWEQLDELCSALEEVTQLTKISVTAQDDDITALKTSNDAIIIACGNAVVTGLQYASNLVSNGLFPNKVFLVDPPVPTSHMMYLGDVAIIGSNIETNNGWKEYILGECSVTQVNKEIEIRELAQIILKEQKLC